MYQNDFVIYMLVYYAYVCVGLYAVSYTHLDVYKRQDAECSRSEECSGGSVPNARERPTRTDGVVVGRDRGQVCLT